MLFWGGKIMGVTITALVASTPYCFAGDDFMALSGPTSQPIGHYEFCQRSPNDCKIQNADTSPIPLTVKNLALIAQVNVDVNHRIRPETDIKLYGTEEYWAYPVDAGDCEDYVLLKQRELHQLGFSFATLLITVVRKPNGEGHAVLTVRTDHGDYVLDNLRDEIWDWKETEYTYLKRQSEADTGSWVAIEQRDDVVVGAVNVDK